MTIKSRNKPVGKERFLKKNINKEKKKDLVYEGKRRTFNRMKKNK